MAGSRRLPIVIAHRGASAYEPENTLRAVRRALELGAPAIEVDVRRTRDSELIVIHDETVNRTTNGAGRVTEMTFAEIRRLDAGNGEKVPALGEVVAELGGKALLVVEIKERGLWQAVLSQLENGGDIRRSLVVSFLADEIAELKRKRPDVWCGILFYTASRAAIEKGASTHAEVVGFRHDDATGPLVEMAHRSGLQVLVWTVDDPQLAREIAARGVDCMASNAPDMILAALSGGQGSSFSPPGP